MKPNITKKMKRHYDEILKRPKNGVSFMWPHPCAWLGNVPRSGIEWAAYYFCKRWKSRKGYDAKKLQRFVILSGNPEVAYLYARDVPGASLDKLEKVVVESGSPELMRLFASLPGARKELLEDFAYLAETMNL
jgi:hypothetical protein